MGKHEKWSTNPTEEQILAVFHTGYTFKIMRSLMKRPMTVAELVKEISVTNYDRIYPAIKYLRTKGLIKIKEFKLNTEFHKVAVFIPTIKEISIHIARETTISTDTKLTLHNIGDEASND